MHPEIIEEASNNITTEVGILPIYSGAWVLEINYWTTLTLLMRIYITLGYFLSMKATDDGYPFIILGYMVGPKVVMMGSLKPHTDVHGMFPREHDARIIHSRLPLCPLLI